MKNHSVEWPNVRLRCQENKLRSYLYPVQIPVAARGTARVGVRGGWGQTRSRTRTPVKKKYLRGFQFSCSGRMTQFEEKTENPLRIWVFSNTLGNEGVRAEGRAGWVHCSFPLTIFPWRFVEALHTASREPAIMRLTGHLSFPWTLDGCS